MSETKAAKPKATARKTSGGAEAAQSVQPAKAAKKAKTESSAAGQPAGTAKPRKAPAARPRPAAQAADSVAQAAASPGAARPAARGRRKASAAAELLVAKPAAPSLEERQRWIATAAYHRAEKRGFAPGYEMQDWFDAESEIDALIGKG